MRRGLIACSVALAGAGSVGAVAEATSLASSEHGARPAATPRLDVRPAAARQGGQIVLRGRGFEPQVRVVLLAGPPDGEARRIGAARTNERGGFRAPIRIARRARAGAYVALACRHDCRVKASAPFRVLSARR
jgi:hypothetical protein